MRNRSVKLLSGASVMAVVAGLQPAHAAAIAIHGDPSHAPVVTGATDNSVTIDTDSTIRADATTHDSFYNAQIITGAPSFLVVDDSYLVGDIVNIGSLTSTAANAIIVRADSQVGGQINNAGLLDGALVGISIIGDSTVAGGIDNSGSINGATAILIDTGSELLGGIANTGQITGGVAGININGVDGELWGGIHNTGAGAVISATSDAAIVLQGSIYDGGITNDGHITGSNSAAAIRQTGGAFTGDIVNSGVIETTASTQSAIVISGGTFDGSISNTGQILANAASGIAINISGTAVFTGDIVNTVAGANRGSISADLTAVAISNTTFTGDVNNSGDITSASGIGINIASTTTYDGDVNNLAGGAITANQTGLLVSAATFTGNISNSGTISSTSGDAVIIEGTTFTGNVTNDGSISASNDALRIESTTTLTGAVTNNGEITSDHHDGVVIAGALVGTFDNTEEGKIGADRNGITVLAGGSVSLGITNSGTIDATTGAGIDLSAATSAHVVNQRGGLLRGSASAINMNNGAREDTFNADGGVVDGNIVGGLNVAAKIDDVVMTPEQGVQVAYQHGTASNIDRFDMAGDGTAILGAGTRGGTAVEDAGVLIQAVSMTHSGAGTLYIDDDTVVTLSGAYTQTDGTIEFFLTPTTNGVINAASAHLDGDIAAYIDPVAFAAAGGNTFTYTDVITGARTGSFNNSGTIDINSIFFEGHVVNHTNAVDIVLGRLNFADALALPGLTKNQIAIGDTLDVIYGNTPSSPEFQDFLAYLFSLPANAKEEVQHAYDELAGAELADTQEMGLRLGHSFDNAVGGRLAGLRGSADSSTSEARLGLRRLAEADSIVASDAMPEGGTRMRGAQNVGIWAQAYGDWTDASGDAEAAGYDQESKGAALGADVAVSRSVRAGAAIGWSNANADFNTAGDSTDIDAFNAAVYTAFETGHFYADAILSYGSQDVTTNRAITLGFGTFDATAGYNATAWSADAQVGWIADLGPIAVEPFAALRYALLQTDSFQETGAGGFNLLVAGQDADSLTSSLGARLSGSWTGGGVRYLPSLEVAWRHEYLDDRQTILAAFEEDPTTRFQIVSSAMASDSAVVRARFGAELNRNLMVHLDYNGLYNSSANTHGATAGITASW